MLRNVRWGAPGHHSPYSSPWTVLVAVLWTMRRLWAGWTKASSLATNRVPSDTPCARSRSARAIPAPSPMPPEASTGG